MNPLLVLHGLGQAPSDWESFAASYGRPVKVLALRGSCAKDLEKQVFAAIAEAEAPVQLLGLSLGAILALKASLRMPERIDKLILLAGQYAPPAWLMKLQALIFRLLPKGFFAKQGIDKAMAITVLEDYARLDLSEDLALLEADTLVIVGSQDRANHRAAQGLAEMIPKAKQERLPGGHELNRDCPDKLAAMVLDFVSSSAPDR